MSDRRDAQAQVPLGRIDLGVGQPELTLLPLDELRQAASARLAQPDPLLLAYGMQQGAFSLRESLARFLSVAYQTPVASERLFITAGASQGIDALCGLLTKPGDTIFVEEPTYFCALRIFAERGLKLVAVPTDAEGLVVDALPPLLRAHRPALIYLIPTFHNPANVTMPAARRARLVDLAREHGVYLLADEVYQLLHFGPQRPPPPLGHFDPQRERVISVSAFTKILAPGLRLGWLEASDDICQRLSAAGVAFSGGGTSPLTSELVRVCLDEGLQDHYLAGLRETFARRAAVLVETLRQGLPADVTFREPAGGYFVWLRLPAGVSSEALLSQAHRQKVGYRAGPLFSSAGGLQNYLRVGYTFYDEATLAEGGERLCHVLRRGL